ncbi:MAG TPA: ABC transporter permease [Longimicrobiales bacterium]
MPGSSLPRAIRSLARTPGFTVVAALSIGLGIGANTIVFSAASATLWAPLPYAAPEELVRIWSTLPAEGLERVTISFPNFRDWRAQTETLQGLAAFRTLSFALTGGDRPERVEGVAASANLFQLLGVQPMLGRGFGPEEDRPGARRVVVLSHALWQTRFGGDRSVIGRTVTLDGERYAIIGVMPREFAFPDADAELWVPLRIDPARWPRNQGGLSVVGRLAEGTTVDQARTEMTAIADGLARAYPAANRGRGIRLVSLRRAVYGPGLRQGLVVLFAAVGFVLLIACANVANLLFVRSSARQGEFATCVALGAARHHVAWPILAESLVLALLGGGLGIALAHGGTVALNAALSADTLRATPIEVDTKVLAFTTILSILSGVLFGAGPALRASRTDIAVLLNSGESRRSSGRRQRRLRDLLVVLQIGIALSLLTGAGLMIRTMTTLQRQELGFEPDNVLTLRLTAPSGTAQQVVSFHERVLDQIRGLPGVRGAAAVNTPPLGGPRNWSEVAIEGRTPVREGDLPNVRLVVVTPTYFRTIGIPVIRGRALSEEDRALPRLAVISETAAERFWPGEEVIGRRMHIGRHRAGDPWEWWTIVGVVGDVRDSGADEPPQPMVYLPLAQRPVRELTVMIRTESNPAGIASAAREAIWRVDPNLPVYDVRTMRQRVNDSVRGTRIFTGLLGIFALVALLLTAVGIYGVISYAVAQRTREIGIRAALGASPNRIIGGAMADAAPSIAIGFVIGIGGALLAGRTLRGLLFGVGPTDLLTLSLVALLLASVAAVATLLPVRRCARADPMLALRME